MPRRVFFVALALLVAPAAARADTCKDVDISVDNQTALNVDARKIEYRTVEDRAWRTEDFANTFVDELSTRVVAESQNLAGIEGHTMTEIRLHFAIYCPKAGGGTERIELTHTDRSFDAPLCVSNTSKRYRIDLPASAASCG
jgi:hypothetical protein